MVDLDVLAESPGLERDGYLEILVIYFETTPDDLKSAEGALAYGNTKALAEAAHPVKGA